MRAALVCLASSTLLGGSLAAGCSTYSLAPPDAAPPGDDSGSAPELPPDVPPADAPLGATPYPGGVHFRVWAPHATRVFVVGDFNAWSPTANELLPEGGGHFGGDVIGAAVGQEYAYSV